MTNTHSELYSLADRIGVALTRLGIYETVITPFNLDRIAVTNAKKFVSRRDFASQGEYEAALNTFASVVATSYMNQVKKNVTH